jgi:hypothetical protein
MLFCRQAQSVALAAHCHSVKKQDIFTAGYESLIHGLDTKRHRRKNKKPGIGGHLEAKMPREARQNQGFILEKMANQIRQSDCHLFQKNY